MKTRITPAGAIVVVLFTAGVAIALLGDGVAAKAGMTVAVIAFLLVVGDQLPSSLMGPYFAGRPRRGFRAGRGPDYIAQAAEPSEDVWRREQERYEQKRSLNQGP